MSLFIVYRPSYRRWHHGWRSDGGDLLCIRWQCRALRHELVYPWCMYPCLRHYTFWCKYPHHCCWSHPSLCRTPSCNVGYHKSRRGFVCLRPWSREVPTTQKSAPSGSASNKKDRTVIHPSRMSWDQIMILDWICHALNWPEGAFNGALVHSALGWIKVKWRIIDNLCIK